MAWPGRRNYASITDGLRLSKAERVILPGTSALPSGAKMAVVETIRWTATCCH